MKQEQLLVLISVIAYGLIGYVIPRTDFWPLIGIYFFLFGLYLYGWQQIRQDKIPFNTRTAIAAAIILRAVFLLAEPMLTDDFWRYIWDGRLLNHGINPYRYIPSEVLDKPYLAGLFPLLNSPEFYSVYPPVMQIIFTWGTFIFGEYVLGHLFTMHLTAILFELGTLVYLHKILIHQQIEEKQLYWYAFNPLVIVELAGNVHTEYTMIFFMTMTLYFLLQRQLVRSALMLSLAIAAKLLPLMFLPLFFSRLRWLEGFKYCVIVGLGALVWFIPFFDLELILKIKASVDLYFGHFEFNASIYYFFRYFVLNEYWYWWEYHDYFRGIWMLEELLRLDWYGILRKLLPIIEVLIIFKVSFRKEVMTSERVFLEQFFFIFALHYFFANTVHPWYILPLVGFMAYNPYRFILPWTALAFLSYISYSSDPVQESTAMILIEYTVVIGYLIYEKWFSVKLSRKNEN